MMMVMVGDDADDVELLMVGGQEFLRICYTPLACDDALRT